MRLEGFVEKGWGSEFIFATNDKYCGKLLKFNAGANLTIAGQRYGNASNTVTMSSYALLDLYASYEIQPKWSLFARWNNALNNQYQLSYGYLTPGSNIFAGVRYTP